MALKAFCGVPGSGKTLNATRVALSHYKRENSIIKYSIYYILAKFGNEKAKTELNYYSKFEHNKINNIYSTYPILLDKKHNIYSNRISLWDLNNDYSFYPNAMIIIDEVQLFADSDEYKDKKINDKLRKVGKFLQAHRHYGVKNIIFVSQNPSRIFKKGRNICESYLKMKRIIKIPFLPIGIIRATGYYDLEFYGRFIPRSHEERKKLPFDYYNYTRFFILSKVYNAYDSRYLSLYNYDKPLLSSGHYDTMKVDKEYLKVLFESDY